MKNPTFEQLRCFLVDDNDWTLEEFADFIAKHSALIEGKYTLATWQAWEDLALEEIS